MRFVHLLDPVPNEYPSKKRKFIEKLLTELDRSLVSLRMECCSTDIEPILFKENRNRLVAKLRGKYPNTMVLLRGRSLMKLHGCLGTWFEQDSSFYWLFGVEKPDLWGALDVETSESYILYNRYVNEKENANTSANANKYSERLKTKYKIEKVISHQEFNEEISRLGKNIFLVLSNMDEIKWKEMAKDRVANVLATCGARICNTVLTPIINECRTIKTQREIEIMSIAAILNSKAINFVLSTLKPQSGTYAVVAIFDLYIKSFCHTLRARNPSCLTGKKLLCVDEERPLFQSEASESDSLESGDLCVLDMGVSLRNYKSNLIATIPISGRFSPYQAIIYNIVLEIRSAMLKKLKPGMTFSHLANIAQRTMLEQMLEHFLLEGTTDEIIETGICEAFYPNGIGHFLGIDFYDENKELDDHSSYFKRGNIKHLVAREGMILALNSELYLDEVKIKKRMNTSAGFHLKSEYLPHYFGLAARVQDVVLITLHSPKLLSNLPRTIDEIQNAMSENKNILKKVPFNKPKRRSKLSGTGELNVEKGIQIAPTIFGKEPSESYQSKEKIFKKHLFDKYKYKIASTPMKFHNKMMERIHNYPYDLVTISLNPRRVRRDLIPFHSVSKLINTKLNYTKQ